MRIIFFREMDSQSTTFISLFCSDSLNHRTSPKAQIWLVKIYQEGFLRLPINGVMVVILRSTRTWSAQLPTNSKSGIFLQKLHSKDIACLQGQRYGYINISNLCYVCVLIMPQRIRKWKYASVIPLRTKNQKKLKYCSSLCSFNTKCRTFVGNNHKFCAENLGITNHTLEAIEITYAPNESLPISAATRKVSNTSLTSATTWKDPIKQKYEARKEGWGGQIHDMVGTIQTP